jgi:cell division protein FtsI/penicillin-binding protein 2
LLRTAERLGFNARLPLDDGARHAELGRLTVPYNDLAFARTAAGFEGSSLSPLGAAYLMTLIARGGAPVTLRLHERERDSDGGGEVEAPLAPSPFSARTAQRLTRMLEVTVETGTSRAAFTGPQGKRYLPAIRVAGKTGTLRPDHAQDAMTSWFVGFAPSRNPEIVVSVMLVNGRTYRRKANELARDLLRTYFRSHGHAQTVTDPFADDAPAAPGTLADASAR